MMAIKELPRRFFRAYNLDRSAERRIKKAIEVYHRGGIINKFWGNRLYRKNLRDYCCYIPPKVTIGKNLYIAHPIGVIIGPTAVIGDNCRIYPHAVVGARIVGDRELRESGKQRRHAKIGNNCMLGVGCTIIGRVEIGDNVIVAARAIVTKDVPPNSVVKNVNEVRPRRPEEYF